MGEAIGQLLPFAVGIVISPMPIAAAVLMLMTPRAKINGSAFLLGWVAGVAVPGTVVLLIAKPSIATDGAGPARWVGWLQLVLGLLLVLLAVREWRGRPRTGESGSLPAWMRAMDTFSPVKSAGTAVLLSALGVKNLPLIVGGAAAVAQTGISAGQQAIAWAAFTVIASIGVAAPVVIYFTLGDRATHLLGDLKDWLASNNSTIMAVLCLVIGVKLVGDAITVLA